MRSNLPRDVKTKWRKGSGRKTRAKFMYFKIALKDVNKIKHAALSAITLSESSF